MSNGAAERIRCRATYAVNGAGRALQQTLRCASDSYRLDISSNVVSEGGALSGSWSEATRGVSEVFPAAPRFTDCGLCRWAGSRPGSTCAPRATDSRCRSGHPAAQMYRPCRSLCIKDRGLQGSLPLGRSSALAPCRGARDIRYRKVAVGRKIKRSRPVPLSWRKRSASQKDAATASWKDRYRQSTGKHHRSQNQGRTNENRRAFNRNAGILVWIILKTQTIEKMDRCAQAQPKRNCQATMLANCRPCPVALKIAPEATMGKSPAKWRRTSRRGAERGADKDGDEAELERQAATQFFNHSGAISRSDHRRPVTDML